MGFYVHITKIKEEQNMHYYIVLWGLDDFICYMKIVPEERRIYVSKNLEFENENLFFEIGKPQRLDIFGSRVAGALGRALSKARQAIEKNEFPYEISWCS